MKRILLVIAAIFTVLTSILHSSFWKLGNWHVELPKLTADNQGIVQALNIASIYLLLFSAFITFTLSGKKVFEKTEKLFLIMLGGFFIARIVIGFPLFGFSTEEITVQAFCLITACCYLIPVMMKK